MSIRATIQGETTKIQRPDPRDDLPSEYLGQQKPEEGDAEGEEEEPSWKDKYH